MSVFVNTSEPRDVMIIEHVLIYVGRELRTRAAALSPNIAKYSQIYIVGWIISAFHVTLKPCPCHGYINILLPSFPITSLLHDKPCNTSKPITTSRAQFSSRVRNMQRLSLHSAVAFSFFLSLFVLQLQLFHIKPLPAQSTS